MAVVPANQYQKLYLQLYELLMMGVNTRNMWSCLQKCNKLNKSHLVEKLLNSIHDARTHVYIYIYILYLCYGSNSCVAAVAYLALKMQCWVMDALVFLYWYH